MARSSGKLSQVFRCVVALMPLASLSACSFLLDFDDLQTDTGTPLGGASGSSAAGGTSGEAGRALGGNEAAGGGGEAGAAGDCPSGCQDIDDDPCTVARCVVEGGTAACRTEAVEGLVFERELPTISAERHHQLQLVAGADEFYLSAFSTVQGAPQADIFRLGLAADAVVTKPVSLAGALGQRQPVSLAALAVDEGAGLQIHAYIGLKELIGSRARPFRISFDSEFTASAPVAVGPGYYLNPSLEVQFHRPAALNIRGAVWGAWINEDGSLGLESPTAVRMIRLGSPDTPATSVALLASAGGRPSVLYTGPTGLVFLQSENGQPASVMECQTDPGLFISSATAPTTYEGLWLASWTKAGTGYLTSESAALICSAEGICGADMNCGTLDRGNGQRNIALATANPAGDGAGVIYYLFVAPSVRLNTDQSVSAVISATLSRFDFGTSPNLDNGRVPQVVGETLTLAEMSTSAPSYRGPDFAAAAVIGNAVAIAWAEPNEQGDVVRLQRYSLCLPE